MYDQPAGGRSGRQAAPIADGHGTYQTWAAAPAPRGEPAGYLSKIVYSMRVNFPNRRAMTGLPSHLHTRPSYYQHPTYGMGAASYGQDQVRSAHFTLA